MRLALIAAVLFVVVQPVPANAYEALETEIEKSYGIEVEFDKIEFPSHWIAGYSPKVETVDRKDRRQALLKLRSDLERLDKKALKDHVATIFIYSTLTFKDVRYGGTAFAARKWLYIHKSWLGYSGAKAMGLHHEFSTLLLRHNRFPVEQWMQLNPDGFVYRLEGDGVALLKKGNTDLTGSADTYEDGFVAGYGKMNFENDFNTFFQLLIANPAKLSDLERRYPRIRKKAELLRSFYDGLVAAASLPN